MSTQVLPSSFSRNPARQRHCGRQPGAVSDSCSLGRDRNHHGMGSGSAVDSLEKLRCEGAGGCGACFSGELPTLPCHCDPGLAGRVFLVESQTGWGWKPNPCSQQGHPQLQQVEQSLTWDGSRDVAAHQGLTTLNIPNSFLRSSLRSKPAGPYLVAYLEVFTLLGAATQLLVEALIDEAVELV